MPSGKRCTRDVKFRKRPVYTVQQAFTKLHTRPCLLRARHLERLPLLPFPTTLGKNCWRVFKEGREMQRTTSSVLDGSSRFMRILPFKPAPTGEGPPGAADD